MPSEVSSRGFGFSLPELCWLRIQHRLLPESHGGFYMNGCELNYGRCMSGRFAGRYGEI
jgi:hypothetical protein